MNRICLGTFAVSLTMAWTAPSFAAEAGDERGVFDAAPSLEVTGHHVTGAKACRPCLREDEVLPEGEAMVRRSLRVEEAPCCGDEGLVGPTECLDWQCAAGIAGGTLTGGLTGAAAGAGVGALTGLFGAIPGAVGGGIVGAVAGGLTGYASTPDCAAPPPPPFAPEPSPAEDPEVGTDSDCGPDGCP